MGEVKNAFKILVEKYETKRPLGNQSVSGRIIQNLYLRNRMGGRAFMWLRIWTSGGQ
jgi:hypothetical protein